MKVNGVVNKESSVQNTTMDVDDDLGLIPSQVEEYGDYLDSLGAHPDKVMINTLTMIAEDYADMHKDASELCRLIKDRLLSTKVRGEYKLPLVYVVDSILKNVSGEFVSIMENDIIEWMPVVAATLSENDERRGRPKLKKVWMLWKNAGIFGLDVWQRMGQCFSQSPKGTGVGDADGAGAGQNNPVLSAAGIEFGKDGNLMLKASLREAMQGVLDQVQEDVDDLEKVSLERLAVLDPDLLIKIKAGAESNLRSAPSLGHPRDANETTTDSKPNDIAFLVETRPSSVVETSKAWDRLSEDQIVKDANGTIAGLNHSVRDGSKPEKRYTQVEAIDVTGALATAAVTAALLTTALQDIKDYNDTKARDRKIAAYGGKTTTGIGGQGHAAPTTLIVDKNMFTNDGVKELNLAVVGLLYEVGLPFCLNDGWRFATEKEMADHIDRKIKAKQAQKSIVASHERGWYDSDQTWTGIQSQKDMNDNSGLENFAQDDQAVDNQAEDVDVDPQSLTFPADEERDRCVICGINFGMIFDTDDGIYKFKNCREISVRKEDGGTVANLVPMLIHGTCWKSLGCPSVLNSDQASKEIMMNL